MFFAWYLSIMIALSMIPYNYIFELPFNLKRIRYYVPSEIAWLLKSLKFKKIDIYGAKLGAFSRNDKLTTEDFEMLVIAEK